MTALSPCESVDHWAWGREVSRLDPADPASGNAWENRALFGYDTKLLPAASWFSHR